jgi:hypothetical protein
MTMMLGFHQQKFPHGLFDIFPWLLAKGVQHQTGPSPCERQPAGQMVPYF